MSDPIGILRWVASVPRAVRLMLTGRIHLRRARLGTALRMSDGRTYVAFRETVKESSGWSHRGPSAVVHPRFTLPLMGPRGLRQWIFQRVCIVTTPFFVGLPGFRSKLWMTDPHSGDFAGLYEWDSFEGGRAYAEGLTRVLRLVSVRGTVSYELVADMSVDSYLARHAAPE